MLEKKLEFLEQAVKISALEILEEMDALCEGADLEKSRNFVRDVLKDLLHTIEHFETVDTEEETSVAEEGQFLVGEYVIVKNDDECFYPAFAENFDLTESLFTNPDEVCTGDRGVVIAKLQYPVSLIPVYVVKAGSKCFFIGEEGLECEGTGCFPFQFEVGDTVEISNIEHTYIRFYNFANLHGFPKSAEEIPDYTDFSRRYRGTKAVVLARGIHPSRNNVCYIVENEERQFIIDEEGLIIA